MRYFLQVLESQTIIMILWSLICFLLGALFTITCYWYRINYVVHKAEKDLEKITHNRRYRRRRFTDHTTTEVSVYERNSLFAQDGGTSGPILTPGEDGGGKRRSDDVGDSAPRKPG